MKFSGICNEEVTSELDFSFEPELGSSSDSSPSSSGMESRPVSMIDLTEDEMALEQEEVG